MTGRRFQAAADFHMSVIPSRFMSTASRTIHGLDGASQVCLAGDRVFRIVLPEGAGVVRKIIDEKLFDVLVSYGVVKTKVAVGTELDGRGEFVLEHERIPFVTHPAEWTPQMVREAALFLVTLSLQLKKHGLMLKDNHLLNVTFRRGKPVFLDFGSITLFDPWLAKAWVKGFRSRVLTAVWAGNWRGGRIGSAMLRSEPRGLAFELSGVFPFSFFPLSGRIAILLAKLGKWESALHFLGRCLRPKRVSSPDNIWNDYGVNLKEEKELKRKILLDEIRRSRPANFHELAGNQAVIAEEIVRELGIPVCSSDFVAHCVQQAHERTRDSGLDLQLAVVDLLFPIPPYGIGSCRPGSTERFAAEMTMATALIHHLVALKQTTLDGFVAIIDGYSRKSAIVEWVDPTDRYLVNWQKDGKRFPENYTLDGFLAAFGKVFPHVRELPAHHGTRKLFHFSREPFGEA